MQKQTILIIGALVIILGVGAYLSVNKQSKDSNLTEEGEKDNQMSFFVTSVNPGKGADLGGLVGADAYCKTLAEAAGVGNREWHAYLSTSATQDLAAVNARDRIGDGPWYNAKGELIASNLEELHSSNKITKLTALNEKGEVVNGRGDTPNAHDVLTGSTMDGMAINDAELNTCNNWTSSAATGSAMVGHHDRIGTSDTEAARSWNSSHLSRGCGPDNLKATGGAGLFYCFAE